MSASDWMKMRTNLWDDPRVGRIVDETETGEAAIIGALYWLWAAADEHSVDGLLADMTFRQIDRKTGVKGFADAVARIGWIAESPEGVQIVRFDEHNGKSAKRRASESVRKMSARDADKTLQCSGRAAHLEEERDIETKAVKQKHVQPAAARFADFWDAYPNKKGKAEALRTWKRKTLDAKADDLIAHVRLMTATDDGWRRGYVPMGSTYLNGDRWEDVPQPAPDSQARAGPVAPSKTFSAMAALQAMKPQPDHDDLRLIHDRH